MPQPLSPRLPETRDTLVAALASPERGDRARALDLIARAYRAPLVALASLRWGLSREDAEDLAHEFFVAAIGKEWFTRYDPARGRFRAFLRSCLDDFARSAWRDASRLKRGGASLHLPLDLAPEPVRAAEAERLFEREWARSVLGLALARLREECETSGKAVAWQLYEAYDLTDTPDESRPTYAALAEAHRVPATQVTNHLHWARKRMREHVLATVRLLTGDDAEYRDEVRALTGETP